MLTRKPKGLRESPFPPPPAMQHCSPSLSAAWRCCTRTGSSTLAKRSRPFCKRTRTAREPIGHRDGFPRQHVGRLRPRAGRSGCVERAGASATGSRCSAPIIATTTSFQSTCACSPTTAQWTIGDPGRRAAGGLANTGSRSGAAITHQWSTSRASSATPTTNDRPHRSNNRDQEHSDQPRRFDSCRGVGCLGCDQQH